MKKRNHRSLSAVLTVLCVWPLLFLASCRHGGHSVSETGGADSVYTLRHIRSIAIEHPERALALIDTAEKKRLLTAFDINDLRSLLDIPGHVVPLNLILVGHPVSLPLPKEKWDEKKLHYDRF